MDDDFVPEGYLPLKSAIDRLAQARQTSIQSAQAEIRATMYGRSVSAWAMEQSTGRMFEINSDCWATDSALRWLESGVCQLPNEGEMRVTSERFGRFYGSERARIFVSETDLQRLIKKSNAGKKQSARPISATEVEKQFREFRSRRGDDIPSQAEDYEHMKKFGVSRERVRALRRLEGVVNRPQGARRRTKPK